MALPALHRPRPRAGSHGGLREIALFALAYLTYFGVRAVTEGHPARAFANAQDVIRFEDRLGLAHEAAVQGLVTGSRLLTDAADAMYMFGHWPVILISGVLLFRFRREQYRTLRDACLISGLIGLLIFALFPVAPPRLSDVPLVDTVTLGSPGYRQVLPPALVNQYAAMPSFHAGWNLLVGIVVFQATTHWLLRTFAVLMPAAMAFAVIATANHFIVDVLAGVTIVLVSLWLASLLERRRRGSTLSRDEGPHADVAYSTALAVPDRAPRRERPCASALR